MHAVAQAEVPTQVTVSNFPCQMHCILFSQNSCPIFYCHFPHNVHCGHSEVAYSSDDELGVKVSFQDADHLTIFCSWYHMVCKSHA